jgi:hypothetical protein
LINNNTSFQWDEKIINIITAKPFKIKIQYILNYKEKYFVFYLKKVLNSNNECE